MMPTSPDEDVCSRILELSQPCINLAEAASTELPLNAVESLIREENNRSSIDADAILGQDILQVFGLHFLDPAAQEIGSMPYTPLLSQNTTPTEESAPHVEQLTSRAASSVNYSEAFRESGGPDTSVHIGQNPEMHFPFLSDPFDYELKKLCGEEENLKKNFEQITSELKAEVERKMAEVKSEYDRKSQEIDDAYNAKAMEEELNLSSVKMNSFLAKAFMSKCTDRRETTDVADARARGSQHSHQAVQQTNTHMNSTASILDSSGPVLHFPRFNMTRPRSRSQQTSVQSQSNTHMNSSLFTRPSVTPLPQPRPPPIISNLTPSLSAVASSPAVNGVVRGPAPHLQHFQSSRAPNSAGTTFPRRLVQEHQQQQGNTNGGFVCLSDDEE